jgi:hypothetical protein
METPVIEDQLARYYRHLNKQDLERCLKHLSAEMRIPRSLVDATVLEHSIDTMHVDGVTMYCKLRSDRYNRVVYLFGEWHADKYTCTPEVAQIMFPDLLEAYLLATTTPLDVFLESPYVDPGVVIPVHGDPYVRWQRSSDLYAECLKRIKDKCPYRKNIRFHYADFRRTEVKPIAFYAALDTQLDSLRALLISNTTGSRLSAQSLAKQMLLVIDKHKLFAGDTKTRVLETPKLKKQLESIPDPEVREKILSRFDMDELEKEWNNVIPSLRMLATQRLTKEDRTKIIDVLLSGKVLKKTSYLMDIYLLGRVFRSFRQVPGKYSGDPSTIFAYAGTAHAKRYMNFLTRYAGFEIVEKTKIRLKDDTDACIPLPDEFKRILKKDGL